MLLDETDQISRPDHDAHETVVAERLADYVPHPAAPLLEPISVLERGESSRRRHSTRGRAGSSGCGHHAAFDANLVGVRPDHVIEVKRRLLEEIDGPMLVHGLQGFDGRTITLPRRTELRPTVSFWKSATSSFALPANLRIVFLVLGLRGVR